MSDPSIRGQDPASHAYRANRQQEGAKQPGNTDKISKVVQEHLPHFSSNNNTPLKASRDPIMSGKELAVSWGQIAQGGNPLQGRHFSWNN